MNAKAHFFDPGKRDYKKSTQSFWEELEQLLFDGSKNVLHSITCLHQFLKR